MLNYSKINTNIVIISISIIVCIIVNSCLIYIQSIKFNITIETTKSINQSEPVVLDSISVQTQPQTQSQPDYESESISESIIQPIWKINIPILDLDAQISEGTTDEILNTYVGHFEITDIWDGNVVLAAHNRGYPVNYFQNIKNLQIGDLIIYETEKRNQKI